MRRVSLLMVALLLCSPAACSRGIGFIAVCGNGVTEVPETCDGDCPATCDDGDPCTADQMTGDASSCDVRCTHDPIIDCRDGDGCCPNGCDGLSDSDCSPLCGNHLTEPPETCDGDCPSTCDDLDACTVDQLAGNASDCNVVCTHDPIVACQDGDGCCPGGSLDACHALNDDDCTPVCGNGVVEPTETCDDGSTLAGDGCGPTCLFEICGNGYVDVGEACDDGNTIDGDGCSADCLSDETCGNGYVDAALGEGCDDGNAVDWDGCTGCAVSEFQVNTYTPNSQRWPVVAMAPDGRFVVVWHSWGAQDGSQGGVFGQRFDSSGNPVGGEFQVNTYTHSDQNYPDVAMAADGRFVVVWESRDQDGSYGGVYGQAYSVLGVPLGGEIQVNTYTLGAQGGGRVTMAADGSFFVVWASEDQDGSGYGVYGRRYDSSASPLGGELQINTHTNDDQFAGRVATTTDGRTLVVWESYDYAGGNGGLYGQWYDAGGSPSGGGVFVTVPAMEGVMAMAMAADGSFVTVREDGLLDGDLKGIGCQWFSSTGSPLGPYFQVNTYTTGQQRFPDVGMAPDGRFVVVWTSADQDGSGAGVYGQRYDTSGSTMGGEFRVNTCTLNHQWSPKVAIADDGSFVVAWTSYGQDGSYDGVYAQRFDAQGNPLGRGP